MTASSPPPADPDCSVCAEIGGPHGVPAAPDTTGGELRDKLNELLREAGIEYPLGLRGVSDLVDQRDGHRQRAEEAEAERDKLAAQVAEQRALLDRNHRAYLVAIGVDPDEADRRALGTPTTGGGE